MQTYEIIVKERAVRGNSTDMTLVRTSVGIDQVHVLFDNPEWLDFPITITFAQGDDIITQSLVVTGIEGSDEWVAEATVTVPYEVIDMVGQIRVTLQGTDSNGRHIITAKGSPLSVEEAGDVVIGDVPADAPSVDQWHQAYSQAMTAIGEIQTFLETVNDRIEDVVSSAESDVSSSAQEVINTILSTYAVPATQDSLGLIKVGDGLYVTEEGVLSSYETNGITDAQARQLANLASLAQYCFDTSFTDGVLDSTAMVKTSAIPLSDICDGTTIGVSESGKLAVILPLVDEVGF